ncbi:hypothetical protein [Intestinibacillus massiliensis]|uniref:hypothetical protein n=1 Tax=Intestinibacillus massiliensis TaxID=1871029 RepID=UPI000B360DCB|nr:hypothetical protein [Intestinibacillus massiliensis]
MQVFVVLLACLAGVVTGAAIQRRAMREAADRPRRVFKIREREPPGAQSDADEDFMRELRALMSYDGRPQEDGDE